jgi:hypothetical protein
VVADLVEGLVLDRTVPILVGSLPAALQLDEQAPR